MAERVLVLSEILLISFLCLTLNKCLSYKNYTVENSRLCSPLTSKSKIIKLGSNNAYGVIVKETRSFNYWSGHKIFYCKFEVKDVNKNVIIAVIQELSFRRDETGNCTDFIQFKSDGEESEKYCGQISALKPQTPTTDPDVQNDDLAPTAFLVPKVGKMDVVIYVANRKLHQHERLDLKLVFTSAQDCTAAAPRQYSTCGDNLCIRNEFFNDKIVNCPFTNCLDEGGCSEKGDRRTGVGSKVTVGAISAILLSFILFFGCLWLSRRYQKMCWSSEFSNRRIARMVQVPPTVHHRVQSISSEDERHQHLGQAPHYPAPSAPTLNDTAVTIIPGKDLPPPYESLFPSR